MTLLALCLIVYGSGAFLNFIALGIYLSELGL